MERIEHHVCFGGSQLASPLCGDRHADDFFRVSAAAGKNRKCHAVLYWLFRADLQRAGNFSSKPGHSVTQRNTAW
ncbi:hypothetical protein ACKU0O_025025 [Enterobacter hormaechei]